ncbi:MAG: alkaline phosphatase family protein [Solirubrobacterales bacterium]
MSARRATAGLTLLLAAAVALAAPLSAQASPIKHVVIVYQENHSFDNVFGRFCVQTGRCNGSLYGKRPGHPQVPLKRATDFVPPVGHTPNEQVRAINGGRMDGWDTIYGCDKQYGYACMTQFWPGQIPNLTNLARRFVIADHTFQMDTIPSWGAHIELVAADLDGFTGINPMPGLVEHARGWGCDSNKDATWQAAPSSTPIAVPSCIPDFSLDPVEYPYGGAYRATPVEHVPTIMDELDAAGLSWKLYSTSTTKNGYSWAICPTFAGCLYTAQHDNSVPRSQVLGDAKRGDLPAFSVVLPDGTVSQHNKYSMAAGDNWIGRVVSAIENGPDWGSTAIFITYDDCGCFYDHVRPPAGLGFRVPTVIVSPYAKPSYTDSRRAEIPSFLSFTEHTFGLPALSTEDAAAYDFSKAFDFEQTPVGPARMTRGAIPRSERDRIKRAYHRDGAT